MLLAPCHVVDTHAVIACAVANVPAVTTFSMILVILLLLLSLL
jgi:hypothetical protein